MRVLSKAEASQPNPEFCGRFQQHVLASYSDLRDCFGEPCKYLHDTNTNFEWTFEFNGRFFYIYDWKNSLFAKGAGPDRIIRWHVGGKVDASKFCEELNKKIKQRRDEKRQQQR
jgi:hypothetical protein